MASSHDLMELLVFGFIRKFCNTAVPTEIKKLCLKWYPIIGSKILTGDEDYILWKMINTHIMKFNKNKRVLSFSLLYDMKRDGKKETDTVNDNKSPFHQKCDNKGATVTIMLSDDNQVFGGYCSISWQYTKGSNTDETTFIYLLRSNFGHEAKIFPVKDPCKAIYHDYEGPAFGYSCCLAIDYRDADVFICNQPHFDFNGSWLKETKVVYGYGLHRVNLKNYEVFKVHLKKFNSKQNSVVIR
eukprot:282728_1